MNRTIFEELKRPDDLDWGDYLESMGFEPLFDTWGGFGWMWERAQEKEWFTQFLEEETMLLLDERMADVPDYYKADRFTFKLGLKDLIHPTRFRDALYEFLTESRHISISADVNNTT